MGRGLGQRERVVVCPEGRGIGGKGGMEKRKVWKREVGKRRKGGGKGRRGKWGEEGQNNERQGAEQQPNHCNCGEPERAPHLSYCCAKSSLYIISGFISGGARGAFSHLQIDLPPLGIGWCVGMCMCDCKCTTLNFDIGHFPPGAKF